MESRLKRAPSLPRPLRAYRRVALLGGLLAGGLFVAAQAGPLGFIQLELAQLSKNALAKPGEANAQHSNAGARAESADSAGGARNGQAAAPAARQAAASGQMVEFDLPADDEDVSAKSPDLFTLAQLQMPARLAAWQSQAQPGSAFHGMAGNDLGGFASAAPAGTPSRRTPEGESAPSPCCTDPAAPDNGLQPLQNAALLSGPIPEPTTWMTLILGVGLSGLMLRGRRRRWA